MRPGLDERADRSLVPSSPDPETGEPEAGRDWLDDGISDAELAALALAAEPDPPLGADAVPPFAPAPSPGLLASWYMPATSMRRCSGWRVPVVVAIVVTLVTLEALGLCSVFGQVVVG